jgi:sugar-specific transcriptional regulator TrmB
LTYQVILYKIGRANGIFLRYNMLERIYYMKQIHDFLIDLGLSDAESKIYYKLLEMGQCSVTELAHSLNMNRVTAHFNIKSLIDKGLITHLKQGRSRELHAQPPDALQYLIEKRESDAKNLREAFSMMLPLMNKAKPSKEIANGKFDVRFFQGENGVRAIYREVLKSNELRSYVNISSISQMFPENPSLFPDAVSSKHLTMWEIIEDSPKSREYLKTINPQKYFYKFFPPEWNISLFDYMIFDGKIAMIAGKQEISGILIDNAELYDNAKILFELMWKLLPEPQLIVQT